MTREDVEELASVAHSEREDQPIWFSSSERGLGCGRGGVAIAQSEIRATGIQHARPLVNRHWDGGVNASLADVPAAAEPTLPLLDLAHPQRGCGHRPERGREHRATAQAMALGQGERLKTAVACLRERDE